MGLKHLGRKASPDFHLGLKLRLQRVMPPLKHAYLQRCAKKQADLELNGHVLIRATHDDEYALLIKKKCTLVQALRLCTGRTAHRGSRRIALPSHDHGTRTGEGSASRPGRSLPPGKTRYPLYRRLGGPQGRPGQVRKISTPPGFDPWTVEPIASRYTD